MFIYKIYVIKKYFIKKYFYYVENLLCLLFAFTYITLRNSFQSFQKVPSTSFPRPFITFFTFSFVTHFILFLFILIFFNKHKNIF
jgi:hypothetical protein